MKHGKPITTSFSKVIDRAMIACENSGHSVPDDFAEVSKIVEAGAVSKPKKDYELSRYSISLMKIGDGLLSEAILSNGIRILRMRCRNPSLVIVSQGVYPRSRKLQRERE